MDSGVKLSDWGSLIGMPKLLSLAEGKYFLLVSNEM
jgi:hypothetical protein